MVNINDEREKRISAAVDAIFAYDPYNGLLWHEMMEQFRAESDADIAKILESIIEEDESGETEELEEVLAQFQVFA